MIVIRKTAWIYNKQKYCDITISVNDDKLCLTVQKLVGVPNKGKEGLRMKTRQYYSTYLSKDKNWKVSEIEKKKSPGANLSWELKHNDMMKSSDERFRFLIKSVYNVIQTAVNKTKCLLCCKEVTLTHTHTHTHTLSGCSVVLCQGGGLMARWSP